MKIKSMKLGNHSSKFFCSYCKQNVSFENSDYYCSKNVISTTEYTIIPNFNDIKYSLLNLFYPDYYKKIE